MCAVESNGQRARVGCDARQRPLDRDDPPGHLSGAAQFDNHANFRGGIQPAWQHFGPVVATCLDLGITPRFIPPSEPWRNGVVEHFNDVWDMSTFRTETFTGIGHLRAENTTFIEFHNTHHRYVTATIRVHARHPTVVTFDGELIHLGDINLSRILR